TEIASRFHTASVELRRCSSARVGYLRCSLLISCHHLVPSTKNFGPRTPSASCASLGFCLLHRINGEGRMSIGSTGPHFSRNPNRFHEACSVAPFCTASSVWPRMQ